MDQTADRDLNCFSYPLQNSETLTEWFPISKSEIDPTKNSKVRTEYYLRFYNQKTKEGTYSYSCKLEKNDIPLFPSLSQPPVKIIKLEQQATSDTSFLKENTENELFEEIIPILVTTIQEDQIEVTLTPAKEKTLDKLLSTLKSQNAKYRQKNKLKPMITRYALKNEKNRERRLIMEVSKMIDLFRVKFLEKYSLDINMISRKKLLRK